VERVPLAKKSTANQRKERNQGLEGHPRSSFWVSIESQYTTSYTVYQKTCDYIFYNNFNNKCPITIIFGTVSSKSTMQQVLKMWKYRHFVK